MPHMGTTQKVAVFVSHTSDDDSFVRDLRLRLERRKYTVLEDSTTFRPGDDLPKKVKEAIDRADHVVAVVSAAAVQSGWVKTEVRYAR